MLHSKFTAAAAPPPATSAATLRVSRINTLAELLVRANIATINAKTQQMMFISIKFTGIEAEDTDITIKEEEVKDF
jgi:hypothetical protein